ncbi:hypothetical protein ACFOD9_05770 [Novosphingobium bradum]|uniref:Uncharacterized protein n=1 Tax=Novosphingobium bradum TaxID=1737444 RepID=A0ABV7IR81_9SPHN
MLTLGKSAYWRNIQPTGAIADFVAVWRQAGKRRWPFVAAALATTLLVFNVIVQESWKGPPRRPSVTYINSWTGPRSDAEIKREIIANQQLQDRLAAEQAQREAKVRDIYRTLGKVSGMDTEAIERQAAAQAAQDKAAHDRAIGLKAPAATAAATAPEKPAAR